MKEAISGGTGVIIMADTTASSKSGETNEHSLNHSAFCSSVSMAIDYNTVWRLIY